MRDLWLDFKQAARSLVNRPGFSVVAIAVLALAIGATSAVFGVVDGVLLRALPYAEPDRLVAVWTQFPEDGLFAFPVSEAEYLGVAEESRLLDRVGAAASGSAVLAAGDDPERLEVAALTASAWPTLGVEPALGRVFGAAEDVPGGPRLAVVSHRFWQRRLGGGPEVLGSTLSLDGEPYEVVGVMPEGFFFPTPGAELWVPLGLEPGERQDRSGHYLVVVGRMAPGAGLEPLRSELGAVAERWRAHYRHAHPLTAAELRGALVGPARRPLTVLAAAVGLVLLIACANVAGLLLARGEGRRRELAVRAALGASRVRLLRQLLVESLLLALAGGAVGLVAAPLGIDLLLAAGGSRLPRADQLGIDGRTVVFALAASLVTCLLFGLLPGLRAARRAPQTGLRQGAPAAPGTARHRLRGALVVSEVALAVVLVAAAGMLVRSFVSLAATAPGMDSGGVLTARLELSAAAYAESDRVVTAFESVVAAAEGLPGVGSASLITALPLRSDPPTENIRLPGRRLPSGEEQAGVRVQLVAPGLFRTLGIPLDGRDFTAADRAGAPRVAIVNRALADAYLSAAGDRPLGTRLELLAAKRNELPFEVVGVAGDVRDAGLGDEPRPTLYLSHAQAAPQMRAEGLGRGATIVLRGAGEPASRVASLRRRVAEVDPALVLFDVEPLERVVDDSLARPRLLAWLLGGFSAVALLLAGLGIYGLLTQLVGQRQRELAVRFALGARRADVQRLVIGGVARLVAVGLAVGIAGGLAAGRGLAGLLHGVGAADPLTLGATTAILGAAALAACWLPARRAARVDPNRVLRSE
jgi:predicted permease